MVGGREEQTDGPAHRSGTEKDNLSRANVCVDAKEGKEPLPSNKHLQVSEDTLLCYCKQHLMDMVDYGEGRAARHVLRFEQSV